MPLIHFGRVACDLKAVIFDKDGTLLDCFAFWYALAEERARALGESGAFDAALLAEYNASIGYESTTRWIDPAGPLALAPREEEVIVATSVLYRHTKLGWSNARAVVERAYGQAEERFRERIPAISRALPGVDGALKDLRAAGIKLGVATTDTVPRSQAMLNAAGLLEYFDYLGARDLVKRGKPHPDMVHHVCEKLGVAPGEAAMVGDTPDDMILGRNAGVRLRAGVLSGTNPRETLEPLADVVLASVAEIRPDRRG